MASFKSVPCWRKNGTDEGGSWRTTDKSVRIIARRSLEYNIGNEQVLGKNFTVLLVRDARVAGM